MDKCIFCQIVEGEIPSKNVYEDDSFLAFNDINPKAPVHVLVIPKQHTANLNDMTSAKDLGNLMQTVVKVANKLEIQDAYKVVIHVGENAGQVVPHLHVHVMGGFPDKQGE
jgi:histidine triad (HIT) family protein